MQETPFNFRENFLSESTPAANNSWFFNYLTCSRSRIFFKRNEMHRNVIRIGTIADIYLSKCNDRSRCILRKHFQSVNARSVSLPLILLKENYIPELDA